MSANEIICYDYMISSSQTAVQEARDILKINFLELNWEDTETWLIPDSDIRTLCSYIQTGLDMEGQSVFVHCAQVKEEHNKFLRLVYNIYASLDVNMLMLE